MENTERGMKQNLDISKFLNLEYSIHLDVVKTKYCNATLLRMLEEGLHADVLIHVNGGSVKAHKAVLVSVSPVFEAMFMHAMQEQFISAVNLPDISISIQGLELFLVLVYVLNDRVVAPLEFQKSILEHFDELFEACCKYQVRRLQPILIGSLKLPENCWDYFRNKSTCWINCDCYEFILEHYKEVIESEKFILEMRTRPVLAQFFLKEVVQKLSSGGNVFQRKHCFTFS